MADDDKPKPRKEPRIPDEELSTLVDALLRDAMGSPGSKIAKDRQRNLDAYLAEPVGEWAPPDIDDRSQIVATDVADTVEWMLPSLLRIFAASRDAIDAQPQRPQFEPGAQLVRDALQWLFWDRMDGLEVLHTWLKDGLISKVGFVEVGYEAADDRTARTYEGLTLPQVQALVASGAVQITAATSRTEQTDAGPVEVYDVETDETVSDARPTLTPVPPEEMRLDNGATYTTEPRFIARVRDIPRSALLADGWPVSGMTGTGGTSHEGQEEVGRRQIDTLSRYWDDDEDPTLEYVEAYLRRGAANAPTWIRVVKIDGKLMERQDDADGHPWVWWCPSPMPHVFFGSCPADFAIEPQRLRTRLLRAVEDNVYLSVNGRTGVVNGDPTTVDDLLDSRPGGIVRLRSKDDLVPIVQPDMTASAWNAVEWAQQWTEQRTGFSRLSKGLSSDAINDTATGVAEITERADMRVELIARHAAAALSKALAKVLRVLSTHQDVAQMARIAGQWVEVDPRDWDTRYMVRVRVGLGTNNKDREVAQLGQLAAMQGPLAQAGVIPPPAVIALARDVAKAMGRDAPEKYFPDPPPPQPPQPPLPLLIEQTKAQAQIQMKQADMQVQLQARQAELQVQAANDARDQEREREAAAMKAQLEAAKQENDRLIAEMREAANTQRAELDAQVKLAIAGMGAQPDTGELVGQLHATVQGLLAEREAPIEILRDPASGRVVGSRKGDVLRQVVRDEQGRPIGAEVVVPTDAAQQRPGVHR